MNLVAIAGMSFVIGLSGALMPGPLLTVTVAETVRRGIWAGPLLAAGHAILEGLLVVLFFFGLAELVQQPAVFSVVALAGGGMLMWMGSQMLRGLPACASSYRRRARPACIRCSPGRRSVWQIPISLSGGPRSVSATWWWPGPPERPE